MKTLRYLLFLCSWYCVLASSALAQQESRYWYFGNGAGLDFQTSPPTALTNGALHAFEGCASISDAAGVLQFYTDGSVVYDRTHTAMSNGTGLNGAGAATQSAIIVPAPSSANQYYIFTVDTDGSSRGLCYSMVDMTLNGGLGDVTTKNVQLTTPVAEKLTAIRHANGIDAWVVVHAWNSTSFLAFEVTSAGVTPTPVTSAVGIFQGVNFTNAQGYLKASPDAHKLACAIRGMSKAEVFDFDNITGTVSNQTTLNFSTQTYGVEFSPDNKLLYVGTLSNPTTIYQYDLTAGSPAAIAASGLAVATYAGFTGAMQQAEDHKIYVAQFQTSYLAVIPSPNVRGAGCGFTSNAIALAGKTAQYGLPNFLQSFFIVADFTYADTCSRAPTNFSLQFAGADSVKWDFGDPASGSSNSSSAQNPSHIFASGGSYQVQLIVYQGLLTDTVRKTLQIIETPLPQLGPNLQACTGTPVTLNPGSFPAASFNWSDASTQPTLAVSITGDYWVEVTENGCTGYDTVNVNFNPLPFVDLGPNATACDIDPVTLHAGNPGATYLWSDGSTQEDLVVSTTGTFTVTVTANGCSSSDTIDVTINPTPQVHFGNDTTICKGFQLFLNATSNNATYLWQDGSTAPLYFVSDPGVYGVIVTDGSCVGGDTIIVDQQDYPKVDLGEDSTLCLGQPIVLHAYNYGATYVWQDGSHDSIYQPYVTGTYSVTVQNNCGIAGGTTHVTFNDCRCDVYMPNAFSPNHDMKNETIIFHPVCTDFTGKLSIYNRIGQLVFVSESEDLPWDGTFEGKPAEEGVYFYLLEYTGYEDSRHIHIRRKGNIMLIR